MDILGRNDVFLCCHSRMKIFHYDVQDEYSFFGCNYYYMNESSQSDDQEVYMSHGADMTHYCGLLYDCFC